MTDDALLSDAPSPKAFEVLLRANELPEEEYEAIAPLLSDREALRTWLWQRMELNPAYPGYERLRAMQESCSGSSS